VDLDLTDRVAVVTGASRGIGLAIVGALAAEGAHVIAGARTVSEDLERLVATDSVEAVRVDLADPNGPGVLVERAGDRLDILVNNVGGARTRLDGFVAVTDDQWLATMNLNFMAAVRAIRSAVPVMVGAGRGAIVNVSSVNAYLPDPGVIDYCAAKAALSNFSKALSKEFGPQGIRVNCVCPGPVSTDLWLGDSGVAATVAQASGQSAQDVAAGAAAQSVTGRFTHPSEVADLVLLLTSERTSNVTGASYAIDGGLVTTI
jgi:NAD(P)-dependent dehydrogenase (short-subunit alcohol dehydrogenase family)